MSCPRADLEDEGHCPICKMADYNESDKGVVFDRVGKAMMVAGVRAGKVHKDFDFWIHTSMSV